MAFQVLRLPSSLNYSPPLLNTGHLQIELAELQRQYSINSTSTEEIFSINKTDTANSNELNSNTSPNLQTCLSVDASYAILSRTLLRFFYYFAFEFPYRYCRISLHCDVHFDDGQCCIDTLNPFIITHKQCFCIEDPINPYDNIGRSVTKSSAIRMAQGCRDAFEQLLELTKNYAEVNADVIMDNIFGHV